MYVYNFTVGIDRECEAEWLAWAHEHLVPRILTTGAFESYKLYKLLMQHEDESISYCIQFFTDRLERVVKFLEVHGPSVIEELKVRFPDRHVAFSSLMEEVADPS